MKTIVMYLLFISLILIHCVSCNQEDTVEATKNKSAELVIRTGMSPLVKSLRSGSVSQFTDNSRLGLFITKANLGDDYSSDVSSNILSTLTQGTWIQTPAVNLYAHDAVIYAYYPYSSNSSNGREILIQSGLTDFMYGTHTPGQKAINKDNTVVNLTMNHACALVQFNIYKANYPWAGKLDMVRINNAPGKSIIHYNGNLNIQTGEITDLSGTDRNIQINSSPLLVIPDVKADDENKFIKLLLIPTQKTSSTGEVIVSFNIDGKDYTWEVPAGTEWIQGTKYTYDVLLNGNELRIGDVKIAEWTDGVNGDVILE